MSSEEFLTSLWRQFSHNVVCFPTTFLLLASMSLFCLFCFIQNHEKKQKKTGTSLRPPYDTYLRQAYSKLALQSTDYCAAFTQSR